MNVAPDQQASSTAGQKPVSVGALLRAYRVRAGLTQEALAERAGLSARGVQDLERGVRQAPQPATLALLMAALGLSADEQVRLQEAVARRRTPQAGPRSTHRSHEPPHNLPAPLTSFIGREQELAALTRHLAQTRLLTLTGAGGTGKTRLAVQVAATVLDAFPDGVFFVNLAPLNTPALVLPTIAQTLGVVEHAAEPLLQTLTGRLRGTRTLLVLDNVEQVVAAAPQVRTLLEAAPGLRVLATSRVPLRVQGEREYPVPPLALPDPQHLPLLDALTQYEAVRLFIARAQDVKPGFAVTDETAAAVADICVRLDGLPLALELAAARLRVLSPQAMLRRLDHRLTLAAGGTRDLPARQQTLRATIDWSYSLLTRDEQTLFARLAVFIGGGSLEAVEAVCNADGALGVLVGVESLVAQSLLRAEQGGEAEPRFRMLETIHEYAWERLEASGEADVLRQRHAAYALALAEAGEQALRGAEQVVWLRRLEVEYDNLRAALSWAQGSGAHEVGLRLAGALWHFWWIRGYLSEGRRTVEDVLAQAGCGPEAITPAVQAKALFVAALFAAFQSDHDQAEARYVDSLRLADAAGATEVCALALCGLGLVASERAEYAQATTWYEQSLALCRTLGNQWACAGLLSNLAWVAQEQGDYARAVALNQEGLRVNREVGDRWGRAFLLRNLADVARLRGDTGHATTLYEESVALSREVGDNDIVASCLMNLGAVAVAQGEPAQATALYQESLLLRRTMGTIVHVGEALEGLAGAVGGLAQPERAARLFGAASTARTALGTPRPPAEGAAYGRHVAAVRAALGEEEFARAWAEGQAMTLEQTIAFALEDGPPPQGRAPEETDPPL